MSYINEAELSTNLLIRSSEVTCCFIGQKLKIYLHGFCASPFSRYSFADLQMTWNVHNKMDNIKKRWNQGYRLTIGLF